jgi:hypothetical protein
VIGVYVSDSNLNVFDRGRGTMRLPEESASHPNDGASSRSVIEDERPGQTAVINHPERRKSPRTSIHKLAYVNLEPYDNGGVITDISSDGLRFHLVKPVEHGGVVRLSILLGGANHFQAIGELIWMDATRKIGGVRFTVLPAGAADQILEWAKTSNTPEAFRSAGSRRSGGGIHQPSIPTQSSSVSSQPEAPVMQANVPAPDVTKVPVLPVATPSQPTVAPAARSPWVPPSARPSVGAPTAQPRSEGLPNPGLIHPQPSSISADAQQPNAMPWITHFDPETPPRGSSFVRGVIGGMLLCALLGSAAWFAVHNHLVPNGSIPFSNPPVNNPVASTPIAPHQDSAPSDLPGDVSSAKSLPPDQGQPAAAQEPLAPRDMAGAKPESGKAAEPIAPPQNPQSQAPTAGLAPTPAPNGVSVSPDPASQHTAKSSAAPPPPQSSETGQSQLMLARQYLDGRVQPRNPIVASQLLWSAVEKGNSAAEMDLADLYLHGDGVTRNCDQARVLLSVASEKGNPEAAQKLLELNRTGCR